LEIKRGRDPDMKDITPMMKPRVMRRNARDHDISGIRSLPDMTLTLYAKKA